MARTTRRSPRLLTLLVALALTAWACGDDDDGDTTAATVTTTSGGISETTAADGATETAQDDVEEVEVDYLTSFSTFGRDAYVFVAMEKGYFEEEGITVNVNPGSGTVDVMRLIAAGQADFGPGDAATLVITVANEGLEVKGVAAVQQETLAAIATTDATGIATPADLEGKTFADSPASTVRILLPFYAEAAGFDASSVQFVAAAPPDLPRLLASGQVDAIGQFVVGRGLIASATGQEPVFFPYSEHLPELYGNMVMARSDMIEEDPEVVERFVRALMRGLEYSIENPEETGQILAARFPEQNPEVAAGEVEIMAPFVLPGGFTGSIGEVDEDRLSAMITLLQEAGAIEGEVTVDDVFAGGFVE